MSTTLDSWTSTSLSRMLVGIVSEYLRDEAHRKDFEAWYEDKYGKPYEWKRK